MWLPLLPFSFLLPEPGPLPAAGGARDATQFDLRKPRAALLCEMDRSDPISIPSVMMKGERRGAIEKQSL